MKNNNTATCLRFSVHGFPFRVYSITASRLNTAVQTGDMGCSQPKIVHPPNYTASGLLTNAYKSSASLQPNWSNPHLQQKQSLASKCTDVIGIVASVMTPILSNTHNPFAKFTTRIKTSIIARPFGDWQCFFQHESKTDPSDDTIWNQASSQDKHIHTKTHLRTRTSSQTHTHIHTKHTHNHTSILKRTHIHCFHGKPHLVKFSNKTCSRFTTKRQLHKIPSAPSNYWAPAHTMFLWKMTGKSRWIRHYRAKTKEYGDNARSKPTHS